MTDLAVDAALVAEALGASSIDLVHSTIVDLRFADGDLVDLAVDSVSWRALVSLVKDRDRWRDLALQHAPTEVSS